MDSIAPKTCQVRAVTAAFADILAPFPVKRVARAAHTHPKTVARWRAGETKPSADALIAMMSDDDLFAAILRAIGRADEAARQRAIAILLEGK